MLHRLPEENVSFLSTSTNKDDRFEKIKNNVMDTHHVLMVAILARPPQ